MTVEARSSIHAPMVLAFLGAYVAFSALIMAGNVIVFGMYDPKFGGADIWPMYWGIWAMAYTPPALVAVGTVLVLRRRLVAPQAVLWKALAVVLAAMEVSFILDLKWRLLLAELLALCIAIPLVARRLRSVDR